MTTYLLPFHPTSLPSQLFKITPVSYTFLFFSVALSRIVRTEANTIIDFDEVYVPHRFLSFHYRNLAIVEFYGVFCSD